MKAHRVAVKPRRQPCVRWLRVVVAALAVVALLGSALLQRGVAADGELTFSLRDHHDKPFRADQLHGKPSVIFFGYTHCPDICPTTLNDFGTVLNELGADATRISFVFVTLDPVRDTPARLATYLASFDARVIGLTGAEDAIARLTRDIGVPWQRVEQGKSYVLDHPVMSYTFDAQGAAKGRMLIGHGAPLAIAVRRLRALITEPAAH